MRTTNAIASISIFLSVLVLAWLLFQLLRQFSRAELTFKVPIIAAENANEMQNVPPSSSAGVCVLIALHSPVESSSGFRMHPDTGKNTNGKVKLKWRKKLA